MKNILAFLFVIVFLTVSADVKALPLVITGPITNPSNGHTYYLLDISTWTNAELKARELGGHLVTINNQEENDWVYSTFLPCAGLSGEASQGDLWIGYTDALIDGVWEWASGEKTDFVNWAPLEPNNSLGTEKYCMIWGPYWETHGFPANTPGLWNDLFDEYWYSHGITPRGVVEIIPEPATLSLLALGILALRKRKS